MKKIRLGELLLDRSLVTKEELESAYQKQSEMGEKLGRTLIDMGIIEEEAMLRLLAEQLKVEFVDLAKIEIDKEAALLLPETYARRYRALVLSEEGDKLVVGLADPLDIYAADELSQILHRPIKRAVVAESKLLNLMDGIYRHTQEISHFAEQLSGELLEQADADTLFAEGAGDDEAPVVKLLQSLFKDAVISGASDIHIEPDEKSLRVRFRVDGILQENILDDGRIARPLVQRLKMRASLDISEKRIPQDGRFHIKVKGKNFDIRVSTLPTAYGESVVMRLLDQSSPVVQLTQMGMNPNMVSRLKKIYSQPHGMLLVTGPTGSGKTTTLYSILAKLNKPEKKIITVEDPVEYRLSRINQVQVNKKIDMDFARALRAILRQDPDTIMIGEIRDKETAQIAMRSAMTGHFVLATLHTNDAMSSAMRLIDMGGKGYMVASSLRGILAQRLIRLLCDNCATSHVPTHDEEAWIKLFGENKEAKYKQSEGCQQCHHTGYKGRTGVYELLDMNEAIADTLRASDSHAFAKAVREHPDFKPLSDEVMSLAHQGKTSIEEAIRIIGEVSDGNV
jgi:MSHA biogenesis protein MshE